MNISPTSPVLAILLVTLSVACDDAKFPDVQACGPDALIENGEDNDNQVVVQDGRAGYIYTYKDPEGTTIAPQAGSEGGVFEMSPGGANGSAFAMRMNGKVAGAKIVYAGMGLNFTDPKDVYDSTRYSGISFVAKRGAGSTNTVRVKLPDINTDPDGGVCGNCYNDFGKDIKLTEDWQQFVLPFSRLKQEPGWGSPRPASLSTDRVFAVQFQVKTPGNYDVWVDDIAFVGCGEAR